MANIRHTALLLVGAGAILASALVPAPALAQELYWIDDGTGKIQRSDLDGSNVADLLTGVIPSRLGFALDLDAGKMYWADEVAGANKIRRADLDGTGIEDLVDTGNGVAEGIALDTGAGKIYWTEYKQLGLLQSKVRRADLSGANIEDLVPSQTNPVGLALDTDAGKMYWTDTASAHRIRSANLDGSGVEILTSDVVEPFGLAIDTGAGKVYWTDLQTGKLQRSNLDGSGAEELIVGLSSPRGLALDLGAGKVYWADAGGIRKADLDGSGQEDVVNSGISVPAAVALSVAGAAEPLMLDMQADSLSWGPAGNAIAFDVVRGDLAPLRATGDFGLATAECLIDNTSSMSLTFLLEPPTAGEGWWFLVRRVTEFGSESYDSDGVMQIGGRDEAIASSGASCP